MRPVIEQLEDLQPYLDAAQKATEELGRSPLRRVEGASDLLLDPELLADGIRENLCMLDCSLHAVSETLRPIEKRLADTARVDSMEAKVKRSYEIINGQAEEIAALREALAPFANRAAEKGMGCRASLPGGKYSVLTDSQWTRALDVYQECHGGDMCGCKPSGKGEKP